MIRINIKDSTVEGRIVGGDDDEKKGAEVERLLLY